MNLQPRSESITVQQEFLFQTAGLVHKVGNVTLDGAAFEGTVKAGTAVQVPSKNAKAVPYATATLGTGRVYVTTTDVVVGTQDVQVGALEEAYLRADRISGVADVAVFVADSDYRFKVR
jgi:hypothetical protein